MKWRPGPVIRTVLFFGGGTRGLDCNYGWTMKVQLRFWNVSFLTKIRELAFITLKNEKDTKSKMRNLNYDSFNIQPYLVSDKLSLRQKQLICKIRAGMIETPDNYGRDVPCRLCYLARDEMSHVLDCIVLKLACPELYRNSDVSINDAYEGNNMEKLKNLAIVFQEAWRTREKLTK